MEHDFASHRAIIDAWPNLTEFATDIGVTYGAAKAMRRRDRIGHEYVAATVDAARKRGIIGVDADLLARLVRAPFSTTPSSPSPSAIERAES